MRSSAGPGVCARLASAQDELVGRVLLLPRLAALRELAPWRAGMATAAGAALAAAHRMAHGVHGGAAVVWTPAAVAGTPRLAPAHVLVVEVADLADRGAAAEVDAARLSGAEDQDRVFPF